VQALVPDGATTAQLALRWILMHEGVTAAIPGAKTVEQARGNAAAADLPPLDTATMARVRELYEQLAKPLVHQRW
jgi:aryl-alcohol dehydrogenase-like predicted oxidoreductase